MDYRNPATLTTTLFFGSTSPKDFLAKRDILIENS